MLPLLRFTICYAREIVAGALRIAWDVFTPGMPTAPAVVRVEIPPLDPLQRLLLANLVTMTPGSLTVDFPAGGRGMLVHLLYADTDAAPLEQMIHQRYLPLVTSLTRR